MKRIQIKKNDIVTNQVEMPVDQADAWLQSHIGMETFGKAAYSYEQEITPAVYEEQEILDENEESYDPPQFEQVLVTPAVTETINVPAEYEIVEEDITAEHEKKTLIEQMEKIGERDEAVCRKVLNMIAGFNRSRTLTFEQITEMQTVFANTEKALRSNRPDFALTFIQAIEADGVLVTTQMKELCIELLSNQ